MGITLLNMVVVQGLALALGSQGWIFSMSGQIMDGIQVTTGMVQTVRD
jgi:hypothetical protein